MKKLLVMLLVLGMASLANATVIDLVVDGVGDAGHAGTAADPLAAGETIGLKLVLNHNPYPGYSSYDGYLLSTLDVTVAASSNSTLAPGLTTKGAVNILKNAGLSPFATIEGANSLNFGGTALTPIQGSADLVWNFFVTASGEGELGITLGITTLPGGTQYSDFSTPGGDTYGGWVNALDSDLGGLSLYQIPEPMTMGLLGLGSLGLLRRRRRA